MNKKEQCVILCKNIKYLRRKYKLTQKEMAEICHISVSSLRKIERNELPPRLNTDIFFICYSISECCRISLSVRRSNRKPIDSSFRHHLKKPPKSILLFGGMFPSSVTELSSTGSGYLVILLKSQSRWSVFPLGQTGKDVKNDL